MNISGPVESAEREFKQILEEFFISVYDEMSLSSHGIEHHRRVWNYARELLVLLAGHLPLSSLPVTSKLLIACYLHDIGMSVDPGIKHGHHSKTICKLFLKQNHLPEEEYLDLLETIENHDNKEYKNLADKSDLLTVLSVADDLDAFGFTGIYRYSEIYLTRGINPVEIGHLIKINAEKRYDNLMKTFGEYDILIQKQKKRFILLDNFFSEYNMQVSSSYNFDGKNINGYCGIIELFIRMLKGKKTLPDLFMESEIYGNDKVIKLFFDGLKSELLLE